MWKSRKILEKIKPYSPGKSISSTQKQYKLKNIIKLASNENPIGPSKKAINKIKKTLNSLHLYPDPNCEKLKEIISKNKKVFLNNIIIGNGSDELIRYIGEVFLEKEDSIIIGEPSFSTHAFSGYLMGANVIKIPLVDYKYDLKKFIKHINSKVKIIYICNPNNPTGTIIEKQEIINFVNNISENIIIVFDEAYLEYTDIDFFSAINFIKKGKKNIIVLHTFSKLFGLAGLRVGYCIASEEIISLMQKIKEPFNVNQLAQIAAIETMSDQKYITKSFKSNEEGKTYFYSALSKMDVKFYKTSTNFIWIKTKKNSDLIFNELLKKGIIIRPGTVFNEPLCIRVSIGNKEQNKKFIKNFANILNKL